MAILMSLLFFFCYIILVGYFRAFVLAKLWGYFLVPLGLMTLGVWHAWGIFLLVSMFTYKHNISREKNNFMEALISPIILTLATWGIGALIHLQMGR